MKIFAISVLLILSNFACQSSAFKAESISAQPMPTANVINDYNSNNSSPIPIEQSDENQVETQNEKFRVVPKEFKQIDFKNFSYSYEFSDDERKTNFTLKNGEYKYDSPYFKTFNLYDTFYLDLTNDGNAEAIVILWHESCGGSCDGGRLLFYIYMFHQNKLKPLWQFETGSLGYGCGLKSFTVRDRKITMELFGRCSDEVSDELRNDPEVGKFSAKDTTRLIFGFNGSKFVQEKKEFISVPARSVWNDDAGVISIND